LTVFAGNEQKLNDEYQKAVLLVDVDPDAAIKTLEKLSRKKDGRIKYLSKALLSKIYREKDNLKKARKHVQGSGDLSYLNKSNNTDQGTAYLKCYLELALLNALDNKATDSLRMLSYAENKTSGYDKALTLVKYGEALTILNKTSEAVEYLKKAEKLCAKHIAEAKKLAAGQAKAKNTDLAEWEKLSDDIFEAKYQLRIALLAEEYGKEYSRYVKMRILYDKGARQKREKNRKKYLTKAEKVCDEIIKREPDSMYGQAAKFYKAKCAIGMADYKEAVKELKKFVKEDPNGLYRGEALTLLGKIELEQNWDAKASTKYYEQALTWFRNIRNVQNATELYAKLPKKVQESAKPKKKPVTYNKWYRMQYNTASDLAIVNRTTAIWYLSAQEKECLFMCGFFFFQDGKYKEAAQFWEQVAGLDADLAILRAKNMPNAISRLISAAKCERMILTPKERKYIKNKKNKIRFAYAELNYLLEKFDESKKLYDEIINDPKSSDEEKAAACIGLGNYIDMTYETKNAKDRVEKAKYFEKAIKFGEKTEIAEDALIRLACYYQGSTETQHLSTKLFKEYLRKYPNGAYTEKATFRLAHSYFLEGKLAKMKKIMAEMKKASPDSLYVKCLEKDLEFYEQTKNEE
jgi:tetratricopeptide (TPR) repeat protein